MGQEEIEGVKEFLPLAEKYGLAVVLTFILLVILVALVRMIIKGELVPRSQLDKAEEDRDRLQGILDKEREELWGPVLEVFKNLKKDQNEDRG
ncbi:hypothetical protein KB559_11035 [Paenibacillus sp. Marseille-P2973]|uniref:hypothetical protein n=1 Tax=Paenibacillus sp. Marseille-P2973 TaxID=1871032 RepID=UPI001B381554|nr:hypothetical protein [Paenibacillus sp. Marseille-P2973]MBQ4899371.1 hypothetical protein [Paenibacillus sp. Marseille-P2973]